MFYFHNGKKFKLTPEQIEASLMPEIQEPSSSPHHQSQKTMTPEQIKNLVASITQSGKAADVLLELSETLNYEADIMRKIINEEQEEDGVTNPTLHVEDFAITEKLGEASKKLEEASNLLHRASQLIGSLNTDAEEAEDEGDNTKADEYIAELMNEEIEGGRWDDWLGAWGGSAYLFAPMIEFNIMVEVGDTPP